MIPLNYAKHIGKYKAIRLSLDLCITALSVSDAMY
jgi:hypothetical protein